MRTLHTYFEVIPNMKQDNMKQLDLDQHKDHKKKHLGLDIS